MLHQHHIPMYLSTKPETILWKYLSKHQISVYSYLAGKSNTSLKKPICEQGGKIPSHFSTVSTVTYCIALIKETQVEIHTCYLLLRINTNKWHYINRRLCFSSLAGSRSWSCKQKICWGSFENVELVLKGRWKYCIVYSCLPSSTMCTTCSWWKW